MNLSREGGTMAPAGRLMWPNRIRFHPLKETLTMVYTAPLFCPSLVPQFFTPGGILITFQKMSSCEVRRM